jgi:uncharacterized protein DUF4124
MRRIAFTLMSLACSVALATTVYKWVDENGVVHYSDQPHPNAQKLQIEGVQTYSAGANGARAPVPRDSQSQSATDQGYRGCAVSQPNDQQTLPNAQSVYIRVQTDPQVRRGDQVFISMDGQALNGGNATGMGWSVSPIERGSHTVTAQVKDPTGQTMCQTPTVTFYVQQPNLFSPGANANPGNGPPPKPR